MGALVAKRSDRSVVQAGNIPAVLETSVLLSREPTATQNDRLACLAEENRVLTNFPSSVTSPPPPNLSEDTDSASLSESCASSGGSAEGTTTTRREAITRCLRAMEAGLGLNFEREYLLENVVEVYCKPGETLLTVKQKAKGVYIVKEGELHVFSPEEDVVLCTLKVGDFCGELSSFFHVPCTATVRPQPGHSATVLLLPLAALSQSSHREEVPMYRLLQWCTERSYVGTAAMFDKLDPSLLINTQIANCLKSSKSIFSSWSTEARNHIASQSSTMLFSSGDVLYEIDEKPTYIFLILRGSVELSDGADTSGVSHVIVRLSNQGYCLGRELLSGSKVTHTATAITPLLTVPLTLKLLTDTLNQFAEKWTDNQDEHRNTE